MPEFGRTNRQARARAVGSTQGLGDHLRALREDVELSRAELADRIELQPSSVAAIERGNRTKASTVARWLAAVGIDEADDRERWIDPYRLLFRDGLADVRAGAATIVEAASLEVGRNGLPRPVEVPGVTLAHEPIAYGTQWQPSIPPVIGFDPDRGDEFRQAVAAASATIDLHWRGKLDGMRAGIARALARAGLDPEEIERRTGRRP